MHVHQNHRVEIAATSGCGGTAAVVITLAQASNPESDPASQGQPPAGPPTVNSTVLSLRFVGAHPDAELLPENFATVAAIAAYLRSKTAPDSP